MIKYKSQWLSDSHVYKFQVEIGGPFLEPWREPRILHI